MKYLLAGTGNISRTWLRAASNLDLDVTGCVSRSGRTPEGVPSLPVFATITDAAAAIAFDAVIITTPNGLHHLSAIEAAKLCKHVLTEKPLDISRESMDAMIDAAETAGVTLAVSYQRRTNPDNLTLKKLFDSKAFGKVYAADLSCKFWRDDAYYASAPYRGGLDIDGGGPFIQQACHNIDLYQWFFGMPVEVKSMLATLAHNIEAEDHGAALLRYNNGMIGTIVASTLAQPGMPARLEVHTERGYFVTMDDRITDWHIDGIDNPAAPTDGFVQAGSASHVVADTSRHEAILRDFEEAVKAKRDPLITARSARNTTELILQIYGKF
jgi:UDP-N-acetyl-2-amino-2-deoxyglucuronate dehydrogenase